MVSDFDVYGPWIMVTNPSDELVLVDAATGQDVSDEHPDLVEAAASGGDLDVPGSAIDGGGRLATEGDSTVGTATARDVPAELCGDQG